MTHDELLDLVQKTYDVDRSYELFKALRAVLQIKDRPRYSDTEDDRLRSEVWNQAMFAVRETISERLK